MTFDAGDTPLQGCRMFRCPVMVIGIGGAGGNIVSELQSMRALDGLGLVPQWIHIDTGRLHRCYLPWQDRAAIVNLTLAQKGTGGNADLGRALAREHRYLLKPLLAKTDIVILVAGLGGGTGSGMAPYIARLVRDVGALPVTAVTMPFDFEGRRRKTADTAIKRLRCHALLVFRFSNQELAPELGDDALLNTIFKLQTQRIAMWIHDFIVNSHFDQFHPLTKPSKPAKARL